MVLPELDPFHQPHFTRLHSNRRNARPPGPLGRVAQTDSAVKLAIAALRRFCPVRPLFRELQQSILIVLKNSVLRAEAASCAKWTKFGLDESKDLYQPALRIMHWPNRTPIAGRGPEWVSLRAGWYKNAVRWPRLFCRSMQANAVRLQLHALAYNVESFNARLRDELLDGEIFYTLH